MPSGQNKTELQKLGDEIEPRLASLEALRHWSKGRHLDLDEPLNQLIHLIQQYRDNVADSIIKRLGAMPPSSVVKPSAKPGQVQVNKENPSKIRKRIKKKPKTKKEINQENSIKIDAKPKRINRNYKCSRCSRDFYKGWQYPTYSGGFKIICEFCRDKLVRGRGYRTDALDRAVSGGGFGVGKKK